MYIKRHWYWHDAGYLKNQQQQPVPKAMTRMRCPQSGLCQGLTMRYSIRQGSKNSEAVAEKNGRNFCGRKCGRKSEIIGTLIVPPPMS